MICCFLFEVCKDVSVKVNALREGIDADTLVVAVARAEFLETYQKRGETKRRAANILHISAIRAARDKVRRKDGIAVRFVDHIDGEFIAFRLRIGAGTCVARVQYLDFDIVFLATFSSFFMHLS